MGEAVPVRSRGESPKTQPDRSRRQSKWQDRSKSKASRTQSDSKLEFVNCDIKLRAAVE